MPELIIPIKGNHVRQALIQGREDQDKLRKSELEWLDKFNTALGTKLKKVFEMAIKSYGITQAEALFVGSLFGHRSVRLCIAETVTLPEERALLYSIGKENNIHNCLRAGENERLHKPVQLSTPEALGAIFADLDLVDAIMGIQHPVARDGAASMISFFCYDEATILMEPL